MPDDLAALNAPPSNAAGGAQYYKWRSLYAKLAADKRQIVYIPYHSVWRPTTIQLGRTTNMTIETTCASNDIINGLVSGVSPIWKSETPAAQMLISYPITAIRITNAAGQADLEAHVL